MCKKFTITIKETQKILNLPANDGKHVMQDTFTLVCAGGNGGGSDGFVFF